MAVRKIAISVPEDVLKQVDRLARRSKITRSRLITQVLREVSHASDQAEITEKINQLFAERELREEQAATSERFLQAAEARESDGEDSGW